jgi:hypothetical protein
VDVKISGNRSARLLQTTAERAFPASCKTAENGRLDKTLGLQTAEPPGWQTGQRRPAAFMR